MFEPMDEPRSPSTLVEGRDKVWVDFVIAQPRKRTWGPYEHFFIAWVEGKRTIVDEDVVYVSIDSWRFDGFVVDPERACIFSSAVDAAEQLDAFARAGHLSKTAYVACFISPRGEGA